MCVGVPVSSRLLCVGPKHVVDEVTECVDGPTWAEWNGARGSLWFYKILLQAHFNTIIHFCQSLNTMLLRYAILFACLRMALCLNRPDAVQEGMVLWPISMVTNNLFHCLRYMQLRQIRFCYYFYYFHYLSTMFHDVHESIVFNFASPCPKSMSRSSPSSAVWKRRWVTRRAIVDHEKPTPS